MEKDEGAALTLQLLLTLLLKEETPGMNDLNERENSGSHSYQFINLL